MLSRIASRRELAAGALVLLFGLVSVVEGRRLGVGTLTDMGSGFVPLVLGVVQCGLGVIIALTAGVSDEHSEFGPLDRRGAACILIGALGFIVLGQLAGLVPAIFACVFVAALGDRTTKLIEAALLAAGVTVFGCVLFSWVLKIPIPLVQGLN